MEKGCHRTKKWLGANLLLVLTFASVVLGIALGLALRVLQPSEDAITLINYPGELFMRLLKLMILPLVVASLITGCASLNAKMSGKIAGRTILYFLTTSLLAATVGLILVVIIHPGDAKLVVGRAMGEEGMLCLWSCSDFNIEVTATQEGLTTSLAV